MGKSKIDKIQFYIYVLLFKKLVRELLIHIFVRRQSRP